MFDKYIYILTTLKKTKILTRGNNDTKTIDEANKIINEIGDKIEDQYVIKLKIKKVSKKLLKENEESKIKLIGGPIKIDIIFYEIKNLKLKKLDDFILNNNIYIEKEDLKDNIYKKICLLTINKKLSKKLFVINSIDQFITKKDKKNS